jgi:hypothetical protein
MWLRCVWTLAVVTVCSASSCATTTGVAVAPGNSLDSVSVAESFAIAARVSQQYGLVARSPKEPTLKALSMCYEQDYQGREILLCGKTKNSEVHFMLRETMTAQLTPHADSLRKALVDSLRARFGALSARECKWEYQRDESQSGC